MLLILDVISQKPLGLWDLGDLKEAMLILADFSRGTISLKGTALGEKKVRRRIAVCAQSLWVISELNGVSRH
jgi:hypothetical protein